MTILQAMQDFDMRVLRERLCDLRLRRLKEDTQRGDDKRVGLPQGAVTWDNGCVEISRLELVKFISVALVLQPAVKITSGYLL